MGLIPPIPLLLLAVCIARTRTVQCAIFADLVLFCARFCRGGLTVLYVELAGACVFGCPWLIALSRRPGNGLGGMIAELSETGESLMLFLNRTGIGYPPLNRLIPFLLIIWRFEMCLRKRAPLEGALSRGWIAIGLAAGGGSGR